MILLDTSGVLAALFPDQPFHEECLKVLQATSAPFILSPFVLAELDYLIAKHGGVDTELELLRDVADGAYHLAPFDSTDVAEARSIVEKYRDFEVGLADASIVVLAQRHRVRSVLTLDHRHFRALEGPDAQPFHILPADLG